MAGGSCSVGRLDEMVIERVFRRVNRDREISVDFLFCFRVVQEVKANAISNVSYPEAEGKYNNLTWTLLTSNYSSQKSSFKKQDLFFIRLREMLFFFFFSCKFSQLNFHRKCKKLTSLFFSLCLFQFISNKQKICLGKDAEK